MTRSLPPSTGTCAPVIREKAGPHIATTILATSALLTSTASTLFRRLWTRIKTLWKLAKVHAQASKFGAAMQRGHAFAGIQQPRRIEGRLDAHRVRDEWLRWKSIARSFGYFFFGLGIILLGLIVYAMLTRLLH